MTIEAPRKTFSTRHATRRAQQRGIRRNAQQLLFHYGDREIPAARGCYRLSISSGRLRLLVQQGEIDAQTAERCSRLVLITDGTCIITNYHQKL